MGNAKICAALASLTLALTNAAFAQDLTYSQDFENGVGDMMTLSPVALLSVTTEPGEIHGGAATAKLTYPASSANVGQPPAVVIQGIAGPVGAIRAMMRATQSTPLAFFLVEADESRYTAFVTLPADEWVEVVADSAQFLFDKETTDENGRLDIDQVAIVGFCDMVSFIGEMMPAGPLAGGERTLWFDDIELRPESTLTFEEIEGGVLVDAFDGPVAHAVMAGNGSLGIEPRDDDPENTALYGKYTISQGTPIAGILKPIPRLEGRVPVAVRFDVKSDYPSLIVLGADEVDGSSYYTVLDPAPTDEWHTREISFSALSLSDDSHDENGRLDTQDIGALMFGDAAGMTQMFGVNGLWIDNVVLLLGP